MRAVDEVEGGLGAVPSHTDWKLRTVDAVFVSLETAGDQVRLPTALWQGDLLDPAGSALIKGMLGQQLAPIRISRILSYPGVVVAGETRSERSQR